MDATERRIVIGDDRLATETNHGAVGHISVLFLLAGGHGPIPLQPRKPASMRTCSLRNRTCAVNQRPCQYGVLLISAMAFAVLALAPAPASAQGKYVVKPVAELKTKQLPTGPLYWRIENVPTLEQAKAAAGPSRWNPDTVSYDGSPSLAAEIGGKAWLFTLGAKGRQDPRRHPGCRSRAGTGDQRAGVSTAHQPGIRTTRIYNPRAHASWLGVLLRCFGSTRPEDAQWCSIR